MADQINLTGIPSNIEKSKYNIKPEHEKDNDEMDFENKDKAGLEEDVEISSYKKPDIQKDKI